MGMGTCSPGTTGDSIIEDLDISESGSGDEFFKSMATENHSLLFDKRKHQILPLPSAFRYKETGRGSGTCWRDSVETSWSADSDRGFISMKHAIPVPGLRTLSASAA